MAAQRGLLSLNRPRGRRKGVKRLELRRFTVNIKPRLWKEKDALLPVNYQSQSLPVEDSARVSVMPTPRGRRPWEVLLDPERERIMPFCAGKIDIHRGDVVLIELPRVLLSSVVPRSYIYENRLKQLNIPYHVHPIYKHHSHFGFLEPVGFAHISVKLKPHSWDEPFGITVFVIPGGPPPNGVDFIIGKPDLEAAYGGNWSPRWSEGQYAQHSTGNGHNTFLEEYIKAGRI